MNFKEFREIVLADPEVKVEYDALESEYEIIRSLIKVRKEQNITQEQLALRTGIKRSNISRLERGRGNPTLLTLKKLAEAMNKKLEVRFVDKKWNVGFTLKIESYLVNFSWLYFFILI